MLGVGRKRSLSYRFANLFALIFQICDHLPPITLQSLSFSGGVTPSTYVTSPENMACGEPKASLRSRSRGGCGNSSGHAGRAPYGQRNCGQADISWLFSSSST